MLIACAFAAAPTIAAQFTAPIMSMPIVPSSVPISIMRRTVGTVSIATTGISFPAGSTESEDCTTGSGAWFFLLSFQCSFPFCLSSHSIFQILKVNRLFIAKHYDRGIGQAIDGSNMVKNRSKPAVLVPNEKRQCFFQTFLLSIAD